MNEEDNRPDPDKILSQINKEEEKEERGKLKIFFGSSAGVGKTYAMLSAAREQMEKGTNVLVGVAETHGRPETEQLLEGLLLLQPREIPYRGMKLKEFDIETALTRKPELILVDELAHTNVPGSRHPKRWNDVEELLDAGIDVYTTLNVQHVESLSDLVMQATGIEVKETIPDSLYDLADDVVLVDLDEDDLIERLKEGKVYLAPGAKAHAASNFFKKNNLSALRELALRRVAQRVDAEREANLASENKSKILLTDKVLVCIALNNFSNRLLRIAKRIAGGLKAPWVALYVDNSGLPKMPPDEVEKLEALERLVDRMGGEVQTIQGTNIANEIISYANDNNFTKIIIGKNFRFSIKNLFKGYVVDHIIRKSGMIDIYVVTEDEQDTRRIIRAPRFMDFKIFDYLLTFLTVIAFTIPNFMMPSLLRETDQALLYFAGIILISERFGLGPSLFYTVLASCFFNYFFLPPHLQFDLANKEFLFSFSVMLIAGSIIASQVSFLNARAMSARSRERKTQALYALTRGLASTRGRFPVCESVAMYVAKNFDANITVWSEEDDGKLIQIFGDLPEETHYKEFGALQWCYKNAHIAGLATSTMPSATGFYLPLTGSENVTFGVIGIFSKETRTGYTREEVSSFETIATLLASALERVFEVETGTTLPDHNEEEGTVHKPVFMPEYTSQVLSSITAVPLKDLRIPGKILEVIGSGGEEPPQKKLSREISSLSICFEEAYRHYTREKPDTRISLNVDEKLPDVLLDKKLINSLITDLFRFMEDRKGSRGAVRVRARRVNNNIVISLSDRGKWFPQRLLKDIFDHFKIQYIGEDSEEPSLSVQAGIVYLHEGDIRMRNNVISGVTMTLTFPIA